MANTRSTTVSFEILHTFHRSRLISSKPNRLPIYQLGVTTAGGGGGAPTRPTALWAWIVRSASAMRTSLALLRPVPKRLGFYPEQQHSINRIMGDFLSLFAAMKPHEIQDQLRLTQLQAGRVWYVQPSNANTGEGLHEGLNWLSKNRKKR